MSRGLLMSLNVTPRRLAIGAGLEEALGLELFPVAAGLSRLVLTNRTGRPSGSTSRLRPTSTAVGRNESGRFARWAVTVTVPPACADKWLLALVNVSLRTSSEY